MTNNADAQIAREWAETNINAFTPTPLTLDQRNAIAAHILATTTPPTMADMEWEDDVHAGLCALCADGDLVRMIGPSLGNGGAIICHWVYCDSTVTGALPAENLTPLPGTRLDLTPRRESEPESTPEPEQPRPEDVEPDPQPGEAWLIEYEGQRYEAVYWYSPIYAHWAFVENREGLKTIESPEATPVSRLVPERVPTRPTTLVTEDDYRGAPYGTVVWGNGPSSTMRSSLEKYGNAWLESGDDGTFTHRHMAAAGPHQVLRWGDVS